MPINITLPEDLDNQDGFPRTYTVADGTQISQGILTKLASVGTVSLADAVSASLAVVTAGITAMEKEANDGSTKISVWTSGRFRGTASGGITVGDGVCFIQDGYIASYYPDQAVASQAFLAPASLAIVAGVAEETSATGEGCIFRMRI